MPVIASNNTAFSTTEIHVDTHTKRQNLDGNQISL